MKHVLSTAACAALLIGATGCSLTESNDPEASGSQGKGAITVDSSADDCDLTTTEAPSGNLVFDVKNSGDQVTEFYFYAEDGLRIVGEIENVGPGLSRDLVVRAAPGQLRRVLPPRHDRQGHPLGLHGHRLRRGHQDHRGRAGRHRRRDHAVRRLRQGPVLPAASTRPPPSSTRTPPGQDDRARELYPEARTYWERIETVAESFGDLDPKMDLREADLDPGPEVDRLAPDREGPVAAGVGLHRR